MTDWHAYGMLAFQPYCWNQLKVTPRTGSVPSNATSRLIYILKAELLKNLRII